MKYKISKEVAEKQLDIFFDYYELDIEEDIASETSRDAVKASAKRIVKAIRSGRVEITNDDGLKIIQIVGEEKLEYKELDGKCKILTDKYDGNYAKIYAMAGYLNGLGLDGMKNLKAVNLSIAESIGMLFLQI